MNSVRQDLRVSEQIRGSVHWRERDARMVQHRAQFVRVVPPSDIGHRFAERRAIANAIVIRRETRIGKQIGAPEQLAEEAPVIVRGNADEQLPPVLRLERAGIGGTGLPLAASPAMCCATRNAALSNKVLRTLRP
jgi:hypothetical protein